MKHIENEKCRKCKSYLYESSSEYEGYQCECNIMQMTYTEVEGAGLKIVDDEVNCWGGSERKVGMPLEMAMGYGDDKNAVIGDDNSYLRAFIPELWAAHILKETVKQYGKRKKR